MLGTDEWECVLACCDADGVRALRGSSAARRDEVDAWLAGRYDARLAALMASMRLRPLPPRRLRKARLQLLHDGDEWSGGGRRYVCARCGRGVRQLAECEWCEAGRVVRVPLLRIFGGPLLAVGVLVTLSRL